MNFHDSSNHKYSSSHIFVLPVFQCLCVSPGSGKDAVPPPWVTSSVWSTGPVCRVSGAKWEGIEVWEEVMLDVEVEEVVQEAEEKVPPSGSEVPSLAVGTSNSDLAVLEEV